MDAPTGDSFWIEDDVLLAGRYPDELGVRELVDAGVTLFVDLTHPRDRHPPYEQLLPAGVRRVNVAFRDFSAGSVDSITQALDAIDAEIARGGIPYVHCLGGCGRTGTVICCRLVRHGLAPENALARFRELCGQNCPEDPSQLAMVLAWRSEQ